MRKHAILFLILITVIAFHVAGRDTDGLVAMSVSRDPVTFDPHGPMDPSAPVMLVHLYDTLLYQDADGGIHPYLAESWDIEQGGRAVVFHLRDDVVFSNGNPLNADSVIYTFERLKRVGRRSYIYGEMMNIGAFEKVNDYTVRFALRAPSSTLFSALTYVYAAILDPDAVEAAGEDYGLKPVGSGPFRLDSWIRQSKVKLVRNQHYAGHRPADERTMRSDIREMEIVFTPRESTRVNALIAGEIDIAYLSSASSISRIADDSRYNIVDNAARSLVFVGFNTGKAPFDDVRKRAAVAHAINKQDILTVGVQDLGVVVHTPIPPSIFGYAPEMDVNPNPYDPAKAKSLLREAGYTGETVRILTSNFPSYKTMASILQAELAEAGMKSEITVLDFGALIGAANAGRYDLILTRYSWNDPDLLRIYLGTESIGRSNRYFYGNPVLDQLLKEGRSEFDPEKRVEIYKKAQQIVMDDLPWVPLHMPITKVVIDNRISNVELENNHVILDNARISE